ncbi:MAG TPA: DUF4019 domain-containing protein [Caulobacteraceae bacterium]|nr:DUF4019 domain-containing protein [Caulobacteraceae bacterium]
MAKSVLSLIVAALVLAPQSGWPQPGPDRQVTVTADSEPGWIPSVDQEAKALAAMKAYFAAADQNDAAKAYAFLHPAFQKDLPQSQFESRLRDFNRLAGGLKERRVLAITWTKDPKDAPFPGVYAAIDLSAKFARVDRQCGYVILYQAQAGAPFQLLREESNYMDNATATRAKSVDAERAWAKISSNCRNYPTPPLAVAKAVAPLPEQPTDIGYPNVAAALAALKAKPGAKVETQNGWTVIADEAAATFWSFPPQGNPAYPAAVRRELYRQDGEVRMKTSIACEASKAACDGLVRDFENLNAQMAAELNKKK